LYHSHRENVEQQNEQSGSFPVLCYTHYGGFLADGTGEGKALSSKKKALEERFLFLKSLLAVS
jgi:hypothetical protein